MHLVALDEHGFRNIDGADYVERMTLAPDSSLWAGGSGGLVRVQGTTVTQINMDDAPEGLTAIATDPAGRVWTLGYEAVGRWDGERWATQPFSEIDSSIEFTSGLAVSPDNVVWLSTMDAVFRFDGKAWTKVELGTDLAEASMFGKLSAAPDGSLYLGANAMLLRHAEGTWSTLDPPWRMADADLFAPGPNAVIVQATSGGELGLRKMGQLETKQLEQLEIQGRHIAQINMDAAGRVWVLTDHGPAVWDPSGGVVQWGPATVPELTGRVESLFVAGAGPTELPAPGAALTGTVVGRLIVNGQAQAGATVQLCARPEMFYAGDSPCADAAMHRESPTDAQGRFRLETVPVASLGFAFKLGDNWKLPMGASCCMKLEPPAVLDLGDLQLTDE
jgi:streptogramin lyase